MKILQRVVQSALGQYTVNPADIVPVETGVTVVAPQPAFAVSNRPLPGGFTTVGPGPAGCQPGYSSVIKGQPLPSPGEGYQNVSYPAPDGKSVCVRQAPNRDLVTRMYVPGPELQRFPPYSAYLPPGSGTTVITTQPQPCCAGPCRLIPWNWWHGGNGIQGRGLFQRNTPI